MLREAFIIREAEEAAGETDSIPVPAGHRVGTIVPKGGSSCASCKWVSEDGSSCSNMFWVQWHGGDEKLPAPADEYCCDYWEQ